MNPIDTHRKPHASSSTARRYTVWVATATLLALFAHTHAQSLKQNPAFDVAAAKSWSLPFEGKLAPGMFLVASRYMRNSMFAQSVILLIAHDKHGTQGIVINRPSPIQISQVVPGVPESQTPSSYIYLGGPVDQTQMRILVQTDKPGKEMQYVLENVYMSESPNVLKQLMNQPSSATHFRAFAGYVGWGPGQLDREIKHGGWHIVHAEADAIFDPSPSSVWPRLIRKRDLKWT